MTNNELELYQLTWRGVYETLMSQRRYNIIINNNININYY